MGSVANIMNSVLMGGSLTTLTKLDDLLPAFIGSFERIFTAK